jgi:hypothetical protein
MTMTTGAAAPATRDTDSPGRSWPPVTPSWRLEQALKHMRAAIAALDEPLKLSPRPPFLCGPRGVSPLERQVA